MAEDTRSTCPEFNSAYIGKDRILSAYASATGKSPRDRKSTRLNSSHGYISYAVFCLKKKKNDHTPSSLLAPRGVDAADSILAPAASNTKRLSTIDHYQPPAEPRPLEGQLPIFTRRSY